MPKSDDPIVLTQWPLGIDNRSPRDRLPEGAVRDLVNLDAGDNLRLRAGYTGVYEPEYSVHGVLGFRGNLLIADGPNLVEYSPGTNSSRVLRSIPTNGGLVGDEMNGELLFCTANETLRYDGESVKQWGVPAFNTQPTVTLYPAEGATSGSWRMAVTYSDAEGREGGTTNSRAVSIPAGYKGVIEGLNPPPGGRTNIYTGERDTALYLRGSTTESSYTFGARAQDGGRVLQTQFDAPPPRGHIVVAYRGVMLIASDSTLWMTSPMRPHAVDRLRGFFSMPERITAVRPVTGGVYVSAGVTYFLTNPENDPMLVRAHGKPIIEGTDLRRDDGSAVWLTESGYARGNGVGEVSMITEDRWVPPIAEAGAGGSLAHDGRDLVLSTLKGTTADNAMGASDYYQTEIIRHDP